MVYEKLNNIKTPMDGFFALAAAILEVAREDFYELYKEAPTATGIRKVTVKKKMHDIYRFYNSRHCAIISLENQEIALRECLRSVRELPYVAPDFYMEVTR